MRIVAVPGRQVRDPVTRRIVDADGITIEPTDLYWARVLSDGDVEEGPPLPEPEPKDPTPADNAAAPAAPTEEHQA